MKVFLSSRNLLTYAGGVLSIRSTSCLLLTVLPSSVHEGHTLSLGYCCGEQMIALLSRERTGENATPVPLCTPQGRLTRHIRPRYLPERVIQELWGLAYGLALARNGTDTTDTVNT